MVQTISFKVCKQICSYGGLQLLCETFPKKSPSWKEGLISFDLSAIHGILLQWKVEFIADFSSLMEIPLPESPPLLLSK